MKMPRGDNFRGRPGPGRPRGVPNRISTDVRECARWLVEDDAYRSNLLERIRAGTAGQMEALLWQYAYGKPRDVAPEDESESRFERMRAAVRKRLAEDPMGARVMERMVLGASLEQALLSVGYRSPAPEKPREGGIRLLPDPPTPD